MKKISKFFVYIIVLSAMVLAVGFAIKDNNFNNILSASASNEESKFNLQDGFAYISEKEAKAFMGFIYDMNPEDLDQVVSNDSLAIKLLTGQLAGTDEEHSAKIALSSLVIDKLNKNVGKYSNASVASSESLISWLNGQVGQNMAEEIINERCNHYLDLLKNQITEAVADFFWFSESELEGAKLLSDGWSTISGSVKKGEKAAEAIQAMFNALKYTNSSSRKSMYEYLLTYINTRELANYTSDGFIIAMNTNLLSLSSEGLYDWFLNWASNDNATVLNRWAELIYWLTEEVGGFELYNEKVGGNSLSPLSPREFVPGKGVYEGSCGSRTKWHLNAETGVLTIYGNGLMSNYVSPSSTPWFEYRNYIDCVKVLDGVTSIGNNAFKDCTTIDRVYLSADVLSLGNYAFANCPSLRIIVINGPMYLMGDYAFANCTNLVYFTIPSRVVEISNGLFLGCTKLTGVDFSENLLTINSSAFENCSSLTGEFIIPSSVTSLRSSAFAGSGVEIVYLNCEIERLTSAVFANCQSLKTVILPESLTTISNSFVNCTSLESIIIPEGVTHLAEGSFKNCTNLKDITIPVSVATYHSSFEGCKKISKVTITKGTGKMEYYMFPWEYSRNALKEVIIEEGVQNIQYNAFDECIALECVSLPESITEIGGNAFNGCRVAKISINHLNNLIKIGGSAFAGCGALTGDVVIPNSVISLGSQSFMGTGIKSVYLNREIERLASAVFANCQSLKTVILPESLTTISNSFVNCTSLESIIIPEGVTHLAEGSFKNCTNLKDITIPVSVATYHSSFEGCKKISKVTITKGTGKMEYYMFPWEYSRNTLKEVIIEEGVQNIQYNAFDECIALECVTFFEVECKIYNSARTICSKAKIKAQCGSSAYNYAKTYNRTFVSTEHTLSEWLAEFDSANETMSTCVYRECIYCKERFDKTTHNTVGWIVDYGADCVNDGNRHLECVDCNERFDSAIPALGHDILVDNATVPTCTETGLIEGQHCSRCDGATIEQEVIPALGHDMVIDNAVSATCTETGLTEGQHCSRCDEATVEQEEIPALGHTESDAVIENRTDAKCDQAGSYDSVVYCSVCSEEISRETITVDALSHQYDEVATAPTCTEVGYKTYTCKLCGDNYVDDEASALGHDIIIDNAVEATCTTTGLTEGQHCSRCDEATVKQEIVPVKAHNHIVIYDSTKHWKECVCGSKIDIQNHTFNADNVCYCGYIRVVNSTISIKNNTGSMIINYGETLKLTSIVNNKPYEAEIYWYVDGVLMAEGEIYNVSFDSGTKIVTAKLVDVNGIILENASGNEISDSEEVTVKSGFIQKIISFFKNLFGANRTVVQTIFKGVF